MNKEQEHNEITDAIERPCVYNYSDYRAYLNDLFQFKKTVNKSISFQWLAKRSGITSKSHLVMAFSGLRHLNPLRAEKVAQALQLEECELPYFRALVQWQQAKTDQEKQILWKRVLQAVPKETYVLSDDELMMFCHWPVLVILELIRLGTFKADPVWISKKLGDRITPAEAREALDFLLFKNFIHLDANTQKYVTTKSLVYGGSKKAMSTAKAIENYHLEAMGLAKEGLLKNQPESREFAGASMAISSKQLRKLKEEIRAFHKRMMEIATQDTDPNDDVYQLNIQFFPLTVKGE